MASFIGHCKVAAADDLQVIALAYGSRIVLLSGRLDVISVVHTFSNLTLTIITGPNEKFAIKTSFSLSTAEVRDVLDKLSRPKSVILDG